MPTNSTSINNYSNSRTRAYSADYVPSFDENPEVVGTPDYNFFKNLKTPEVVFLCGTIIAVAVLGAVAGFNDPNSFSRDESTSPPSSSDAVWSAVFGAFTGGFIGGTFAICVLSLKHQFWPGTSNSNSTNTAHLVRNAPVLPNTPVSYTAPLLSTAPVPAAAAAPVSADALV